MNKLYFTQEERTLMRRIIERGLRQKFGTDSPQWWVARIALAKSLKLSDFPEGEEYAPPPYVKGGSELHMDQIVGRDKTGHEDYSMSLKLLLSARHGVDFVNNSRGFEETLHRHIRRGLKEIRNSWRENFDFFDYLYQDFFFEDTGDGPENADGGGITSESLEAALREIGVSVNLEDRTDGPRLSRFKLVLSDVVDYERLRKSIDELNFILGLPANSLSLELGGGERRVVLDAPRPTSLWRYIRWREVEALLEANEMALPVCPATDVLGEPIIFDLATAPHLFIGGTTGSGKSICVHAIILSLLAAPNKPELVLVDPKAVELVAYERCRHLWGKRVITDMSDAKGIFDDLAGTMDQRQKNYKSIGARNIDDASRRGLEDKRIVVVVDELADLILDKPEVATPLIRLAQKARAFGIHLVLATQRPDATTFPGLLRSNVPSRIALTVQRNSESRIILDEGGAENLLMRGDMLVRLAGQQTTRAHGVDVKAPDIDTALRQ